MDGTDVVRPEPRTVRRRTKRPRSKAFSGVAYLFTSTVGGYPVPVFVSKKDIEGDAVGYWDPETHEIAVRLPAPSGPAEADRMLHEHIHAISSVHLPAEVRLNELQVNTLSTALIDLFARNPGLWEFLAQRIAPPAPAAPPTA